MVSVERGRGVSIVQIHFFFKRKKNDLGINYIEIINSGRRQGNRKLVKKKLNKQMYANMAWSQNKISGGYNRGHKKRTSR